MELLHHGLLGRHGNMNPHPGMEEDFSLIVHQCISSSRLEEYPSNGNRNISLVHRLEPILKRTNGCLLFIYNG